MTNIYKEIIHVHKALLNHDLDIGLCDPFWEINKVHEGYFWEVRILKISQF